jgi:hypothetical protein
VPFNAPSLTVDGARSIVPVLKPLRSRLAAAG